MPKARLGDPNMLNTDFASIVSIVGAETDFSPFRSVLRLFRAESGKGAIPGKTGIIQRRITWPPVTDRRLVHDDRGA